ncbi:MULTISPECIES: hypothetical protein [unclassified Streptomyces]|nr:MULTISPECIES: hypothetical protein [unclassified Streptomyces]
MTEQERAAKDYAAGRDQRDPDAVQMGRDNARIGGANSSGAGGAQ